MSSSWQMVTPFPFDRLPKFKAKEVAIHNHLLNAYSFFENRKDTFKTLIEPVKAIFGAQTSLRLSDLHVSRLDDLTKEIAENFLLGIIRLEPQGKKAVVVFEPLLAKIAVAILLTGRECDQEKLTQLQLKALTPLEGAAVQYILVSVIEKIAQNTGSKNFTLTFEDTVTDAKKLNGLLSNQDELAVFTLKLGVLEREFYLKVILPMNTVDNIELASYSELLARERLAQFVNLATTFDIEVAHVELLPHDIDDLSVGDLVIFDKAYVTRKEHALSGQARMRLDTGREDDGFWVDLIAEGSQYKIKIVGPL